MNALKAEFWRKIIIYRRYWPDYLSSIGLTVLMCMGIFWGGTLVGNGIIGSSLTALLIGFALWTLIQNTVSEMSNSITQAAQTGTLEQEFLMPLAPTRIFFNKNLVSSIFSLFQSAIVFIVLMAFTGRWIKLPLIIILPLILSMITIFGLGYLIVSLTLRFKRITNLLTIGQYLYLAVLLTSFENCSLIIRILANLLPLVPMISWMRLAVNNLHYNWYYYLFFASMNAILWLGLGVFIFIKTIHLIKQKGTLAFF